MPLITIYWGGRYRYLYLTAKYTLLINCNKFILVEWKYRVNFLGNNKWCWHVYWGAAAEVSAAPDLGSEVRDHDGAAARGWRGWRGWRRGQRPPTPTQVSWLADLGVKLGQGEGANQIFLNVWNGVNQLWPPHLVVETTYFLTLPLGFTYFYSQRYFLFWICMYFAGLNLI